MAVNNKPASVYAGRYVEGVKESEPIGDCLSHLDISVGGISKAQKGEKVNPYGVGVMRGFGAATKGKKISGKMG
jgi:hypothetical protein